MQQHNDLACLLILLSFVLESKGQFVPCGPCLRPVTVTCPDPHINFYLYTRKNENSSQLVAPNKDAILKSHFNPQHSNKIITHGYNSNSSLTQLIAIKNGYLKAGDFNVWMIDWGSVASGPFYCYPTVVSSLNYVGTCAAQLIKEIADISTVPPEKKFHVIGFSIGAHAAGYIANNLRPYKLPRITGLDPALKLSIPDLKDRQLDKTDAKFVDVLHTDAAIEGTYKRCGHIDFYMNGGMEQPGCYASSKCNHHRSPNYFAESITSKIGFWGWPCEDLRHYLEKKCPPKIPTMLMGEYCDQNATGYYIIRTRADPPYAMGKNITRLSAKRKLRFLGSIH